MPGEGFDTRFSCREEALRFAGVDLDPGVMDNPLLSDATVADLARLPYPDETFDLVISKYVFEHLEGPALVMKELHRVMKPGAHLLVHTPNRWHYVTISAALTPTRFHRWFNERRDRRAVNTFPTTYRANDRRTLQRLARATRFQIVEFEPVETKPDYLFFHPLAYRLGVAYERWVNGSDRWAPLRVQLLVAMQATRETPAAGPPRARP